MIHSAMNRYRRNLGVTVTANIALLFIPLLNSHVVSGCATRTCISETSEVPEIVPTGQSPEGRYTLYIVPCGGFGEGEQVFLASSEGRTEPRLIFTSIRAVSVSWSPDDAWFAVTDFMDGHITELHVYQIDGGASSALNVEEVYKSPPYRYDTHWKLESWNIPRGTIIISCTFGVDERHLGVPDKWYKRYYEVPITCKPENERGPKRGHPSKG